MEDESRICSWPPQPLSAVTLSANSKANHGEDASNIIASKDAVNSRKGGPDNIPTLKSLILTCWVCPENCEIGGKEQNVLSVSYLTPIPIHKFHLDTGTENMSTSYLCLHFPYTLMSRFEFSQKQTLRKDSELKWLSWEVITGNTVKRVNKWDRKGRSSCCWCCGLSSE